MGNSSHNKSKWTFDLCRHEALKYSYRTLFHKSSSGAYKAAYNYGWLEEICRHMIKPKPYNYKWTFEECDKEALKYSSKKDFILNSNTAFQVASKNKWLEQICKHMTEIKKPHKYWTKERCFEEALKYKHRNDFNINSNSAYDSARRKNWLNEICEHMTVQGSAKLRYVYSFTFTDGSIYFGLTCNYNRRIKEHKNDPTSKVFIHIKLIDEDPIFNLITPNPVTTEIAQKLEKKLIKEHFEKGLKILNMDKGGGLGGSTLIWTKEKCKIEALKYNTRGEYQKSLSYNSAHKNGWLNDICTHMYEPKKPHGYWSKERCINEALKYKSKFDFRTNSLAGYSKAFKSNWLNDICVHMIDIKKPGGYWSKENCIEESKQYLTYIDFQRKSASAYNAALKNGWLEFIQENFVKMKKPNGYWTYELCEIESKKYKNKRQFSLGCGGAHDASYRNKWLDLFYPQ